jgi:ABC-type nitrate/sulfonate/bicarbonate transport system substrate-binding protein
MMPFFAQKPFIWYVCGDPQLKKDPLFRVLSAPDSRLTSTAGLAGVPIGISKNTIIEYVTDRLLTAEGLDSKAIVKKSF